MRPAFKVVVGDSSAGKTTFLQALCTDKPFGSVAPTVGVDYVVFRNDDIRVSFYDTAGAERFYSITKTYFRNTDIAFLFVDLSNPPSPESIDSWFFDASPHAKHVVLIGSKHDEKTELGEKAVVDASVRLNLSYFMVSSKSRHGIRELTEYFTRTVSRTQPKYVEHRDVDDDRKCCYY